MKEMAELDLSEVTRLQGRTEFITITLSLFDN